MGAPPAEGTGHADTRPPLLRKRPAPAGEETGPPTTRPKSGAGPPSGMRPKAGDGEAHGARPEPASQPGPAEGKETPPNTMPKQPGRPEVAKGRGHGPKGGDGPGGSRGSAKGEPAATEREADLAPSDLRLGLYGAWNADPTRLGVRPRCLHLFSGKRRAGDLSEFLRALGWATCAVDTEQKPSTDLLDHHIRQLILKNIAMDMFDAVHLGTPCSTFSELRQRPGGPRPLRSVEKIRGLDDLRPGEKKALKEGNAHADFSADVIAACQRAGIPFMMENPQPRTEQDVSIFRMPRIAKLATEPGCKFVDFDQCMFDSPATKPTRILCWRVNLAHVEGKRCNHPLKTFRDQQGAEYEARHERVVGRKVKAPDGSEQWASKGLAEYRPAMCKALAEGIAKVDRERASRKFNHDLPNFLTS